MTIDTLYNIGSNLYFVHDNQIKCAAVNTISTYVNISGSSTITYTFLGISDYSRTEAQCFATTEDLVGSFGFDRSVG